MFHAFWWAFAWLYHYRPEGRYTGGLDPVFIYRNDPELFAAMLGIYRGEADDVGEILRSRFAARWVFVAKLPRTRPMRELLGRSPSLRLSYSDGFAEVYSVSSR